VKNDKNIHTLLKEDIFYENTVLEDLEKLTQLKNESNKQNYHELYDNV
jgi:hypothetical protein